MGYTHGSKWNDEIAIETILSVKDTLGVNYMPTNSEFKLILGNSKLVSWLNKNGRRARLKSELCLPDKPSCSLTGDVNEWYIINVLKDMGYTAEKTQPRHPYDILVNGVVKIDVKSANPIPSKVKKMNEFVFAINNREPKCDLMVFVTVFSETNKEIYVIPSHLIKQSQLGIGESSKYDIYKNRFDYIPKYINFYETITA